MKRPILISSLLLLLGLCISCQFSAPKLVKVKDFKLKGYNPLSKTLSISYKPTVHNNNDYPLWVDKVETEILFDGFSLGTTSSDKRIKLEANQDSEFLLDQKIKVDEFIKQLRAGLDKDSISIELDGKYTFLAKETEITLPYSYKTYVNPKKDLARLLLGL